MNERQMNLVRFKVPLFIAVAGVIAIAFILGCGASSIGSPEEPIASLEPTEEAPEELLASMETPEPQIGGEFFPSPLMDQLASALGVSQVEAERAIAEFEANATPTPAQEGEDDTPTLAPHTKVLKGPLAAELAGIHAWINSEPLKISELRGKVVLVDFWTYTCVNCIRTMPFLKLWHSKYTDDGLVILGVHTPEFEFEEKLENVRSAVQNYNIGWPVALDNDYATWNAYRNRYWPAKYLIDKDGGIRYTHFGEGAYAETEEKIRELLEEAGADLSDLDAALPGDSSIDRTYLSDTRAQITRELYAGWDRGYPDVSYGGGYVANSEYYEGQDKVTEYEDSGSHRKHRIYLQGPWFNGQESLRHARDTAGFEDHMALRFAAKSVNVVIRPEGEVSEPFKVLVTLDGRFLTDADRGEDVVIEEDGRSFLYVDEPRMYAVIEAPTWGVYDLTLSSNSSQFAVYAFTFGVYESGI